MAEHDFDALFAEYDGVIATMPEVFTSHQFVLRLAQGHQGLYIDALASYRDKPAPFQIVHGILAKHLSECDNLEKLGQVASTDIFGRANECAQWRRV